MDLEGKKNEIPGNARFILLPYLYSTLTALSPESLDEHNKVNRLTIKGVRSGQKAELDNKKITGLVWGPPIEKVWDQGVQTSWPPIITHGNRAGIPHKFHH